jgi:formamidopyrimidine-DNA glycosylase
MPEGHSVHRIARQFALHFVGHRVEASSPQGRFTVGAAEIDGLEMTGAKAVGKQMFLEFDHRLWLRVHLGMYGAWDFAGDITAPLPSPEESADGARLEGGHSGNSLRDAGSSGSGGVMNGQHEESLHSIGAPRRTRLRMAESEKLGEDLDVFPPEPIGEVRVRLLTENAVADLRGAMVCEVLSPEEVAAVIAKQGPDPLLDDGQDAEDRFTRVVRKKPTPIALLLLDQSVVSGIGNVYRAELLFRARLNPHTPGKLVPEELVRELWRDWSRLLRIGVETGQMMTMDDLDPEAHRKALASRADRHWVYHREGLPCRVCGTHIVMELAAARKLYWCPQCQA